MARVGEEATRVMTVDGPILKAYAEITGDYNLLNFAEELVAATPFTPEVPQQGSHARRLLC